MEEEKQRTGKGNGGYSQSDEDSRELRRGPWTVGEDFALINYIAHHGEGRWNSLSRCAGLKRTGKSCRLRWLNYLRPDVRRGNITLEEQLLILELHSRWGNRWSKIAQHLPGRTDNEIKNYWRTRVQKHAKQLKCDVNSKQFKDTMRYLWMPRLVERIQAAAAADSGPVMCSSSTATSHLTGDNSNMRSQVLGGFKIAAAADYTAKNSSAAASSDSFGTPASEVTDCYNNYQGNNQDYFPAANQISYVDQSMNTPSGFYNQGMDFMDQSGQWMNTVDADAAAEWFLNDDLLFFSYQLNTNTNTNLLFS